MANKTSVLQSAADIGIYGGNKDSAPQISNFVDGSGQLGVGFNASFLDSSTPLTMTPIVPVVLTTPGALSGLEGFGETLKTLIETHSKTITGIDFSLTVNTEEGGMGHDGQPIPVPTQVVRSAVTPSMTFDELPGNYVWRLFYTWIRNLQDPDTNASFQYTGNEELIQFLPSEYAMTMLVIQFDRTCKPENILEAALYYNMFPTSLGELGLERNIATTKVVERTIEFVGLVKHNDTIRDLAIEYAKEMKLANATLEASANNIINRMLPPDATDGSKIVLSNELANSGLKQEVDRVLNG